MPYGDIQHDNPYGKVTARQTDQNGYVTIERNPITRVGVFPYSGRNLPGAEPDRVYNVLRPEEEVCSPETLESFKLLPLIDDHVMLGEGFTPVESVTTHGTSGEGVVAEKGVVYAPLRIFSEALKRLIDAGKKGLSVGYRCVYEKASGVWQGQSYDYIQRKIRGNHIALVQEGRMGRDIAVLDHQWAFDSFDLNNKEFSKMAEPEKKDDKKDEGKGKGKDEAIGLEQVHAWAKANMGMFKELQSMMAGENAEGGALDDAEEKKKAEEKAAKDAEEEKEKKKGEDAAFKSAMDAMEKRFEEKLAAVTKSANPKAIRAEMRHAETLAGQVAAVVGTFDHSEMTAIDVAIYGCEKLGLKPAKGQEEAVLAGYLAGRRASAPAIGFAQDVLKAKSGGKLAETIAQHA